VIPRARLCCRREHSSRGPGYNQVRDIRDMAEQFLTGLKQTEIDQYRIMTTSEAPISDDPRSSFLLLLFC